MSTLDIKSAKQNRQVRKTALAYLFVTFLCVAVDRIYANFGHGITSDSMTYMFLFPLLGGVLPFLLLWQMVPQADGVRHYRLLYNGYNTGIAMLTIRGMLNGVFEIAGTASPYMTVFLICGWAALIVCAAGYLLSRFKARTAA